MLRVRRLTAARAEASDDQAPIMLSIGWSARLSRTEEAMIAPAEISPAMASSGYTPLSRRRRGC